MAPQKTSNRPSASSRLPTQGCRSGQSVFAITDPGHRPALARSDRRLCSESFEINAKVGPVVNERIPIRIESAHQSVLRTRPRHGLARASALRLVEQQHRPCQELLGAKDGLVGEAHVGILHDRTG
eukprot:4033339-Prymnesium_polylepis.1